MYPYLPLVSLNLPFCTDMLFHWKHSVYDSLSFLLPISLHANRPVSSEQLTLGEMGGGEPSPRQCLERRAEVEIWEEEVHIQPFIHWAFVVRSGLHLIINVSSWCPNQAISDYCWVTTHALLEPVQINFMLLSSIKQIGSTFDILLPKLPLNVSVCSSCTN